MECKRIKYLVSLYIDGEVSKEESIEILEHLNSCKECEKYFNEFIESHEELSAFSQNKKLSDECKINIINEINKDTTYIYEGKNNRKSSYKWKLAVCAALIAIVMVVPVNGKTVLATVSDWVSSLFIEKDGITIGVKVKDHEKGQSKEERLKYEETIIYDIDDLKELERNINRPLVPGYMIEAYEFLEARVKRYEEVVEIAPIDGQIVYSLDGSYKNSINIFFTIYKDDKYNSNSWRCYVDEKTVSKEVGILDTKGIITRDKFSDSSNGYISYDLDVIEGRYPIDFWINSNNILDENFNGETIEKELIKIAESLFERIYNELEEVEEIKDIPNMKLK